MGEPRCGQPCGFISGTGTYLHRGDIVGGKPTPPMVPSVGHAVAMAGSKWDVSKNCAMQEGGRAKETTPGRGGGEVGHLQGLQCVRASPGYGVLF